MRVPRSVALNQNGPLAAGWLVSCLLHGGLMAAALLFIQQLQLFPETEPFQWNVAMVGGSSSSTMPPPTTPSTAPPSTPNRFAPPTTKPVHPKTATQMPVPQSTPPDSVSPGLESTNSAQDQSASRMPVEPSTQLRPTTEPLPSTLDESRTQPTDSESSIASIPSVELSPGTTQSNPARDDYGWLMDLMAKWTKDLNKRYPPLLRKEGIQRVTLTAVVHEDGQLTDVQVVKSSGNAALDEVALEDVKNGPLIKLSHPLEHHQKKVKFTIRYDLEATP